MDVLRAALGEAKLTYFGASYGTKLGATYAELFPDRVGRLVLDGAVDLSLSPRSSASSRPRVRDRAAGLRRELRRRAPTPASSATPSTRACSRIRDFLDEVDARPLPTGHGRELDGGQRLLRHRHAALQPRLLVPAQRRRSGAAFDGNGAGAAAARPTPTPRGAPTAYANNPMEALYASAASTTRPRSRPPRCASRVAEFEEASPTFGQVVRLGPDRLRRLPGRADRAAARRRGPRAPPRSSSSAPPATRPPRTLGRGARRPARLGRPGHAATATATPATTPATTASTRRWRPTWSTAPSRRRPQLLTV